MNYRDSHNIGLPSHFLNNHAQNGLLTPRAYFESGKYAEDLVVEKTYKKFEGEVPTDSLAVEKESEAKAPKKNVPILTRNGKIAFVVIILGVIAYRIYKSHQEKKSVNENTMSEGGEVNNETIEQGQQPLPPVEGGQPQAPIQPTMPTGKYAVQTNQTIQGNEFE